MPTRYSLIFTLILQIDILPPYTDPPPGGRSIQAANLPYNGKESLFLSTYCFCKR